MAIDLSFVSSVLSSMSPIAVILGAIFVVFQLRQNNRLISAILHQEKSNTAFSLLEKITHESFAKRRAQMHQAVKKYSAINWEGFDDTQEDY